MKRMVQKNAAQCTEVTSVEMQEEHGPKTPHSPQNFQAHNSMAPCRAVQQHWIKWPVANKRKVWCQFDEDVARIITATSKAAADEWLQMVTTTTVSFAAERLGIKECKASRPNYTMNHRVHELWALARQFKAGTVEEKPPLTELWHSIRKKLMTLHRAAWHRRWWRDRARKRPAFIANPFGFTKQLLWQKRSQHLTCSKEGEDLYLHNTISYSERKQELGPLRALLEVSCPTVDFNTREPTWREVQEVVSAARASSTPGTNGVPYKVYKHCPAL